MPKFKQITLTPRNVINAPEGDFVKVQLYINSNGSFYATIPDRIIDAMDLRDVVHPNKSWVQTSVRNKTQLFNKRYEGLVDDLTKLFREVVAPVVTTELVIIYAVTSNVSYAQNEEGDVAKNAVGDGFEWYQPAEIVNGRGRFVMDSETAYRLSIGARVYCKEITTYAGHNPQVKYKNLNQYQGEIPQAAKELNTWVKLSPLEHNNHQIIPYTDQTAVAFDSLMHSLVLLSKRVTDFFARPDAIALLGSSMTSQGLDFNAIQWSNNDDS